MESSSEITQELIFITSMSLTSLGMGIGAAKKPLKEKGMAMFFAIVGISLFNFFYIKKFRLDVFLFIVFSVLSIVFLAHFVFHRDKGNVK